MASLKFKDDGLKVAAPTNFAVEAVSQNLVKLEGKASSIGISNRQIKDLDLAVGDLVKIAPQEDGESYILTVVSQLRETKAKPPEARRPSGCTPGTSFDTSA